MRRAVSAQLRRVVAEGMQAARRSKKSTFNQRGARLQQHTGWLRTGSVQLRWATSSSGRGTAGGRDEGGDPQSAENDAARIQEELIAEEHKDELAAAQVGRLGRMFPGREPEFEGKDMPSSIDDLYKWETVGRDSIGTSAPRPSLQYPAPWQCAAACTCNAPPLARPPAPAKSRWHVRAAGR